MVGISYLDWLVEQVDAKRYSDLAAFLHSRKFKAVLRRDNNRIDDGLRLRRLYGGYIPLVAFDDNSCSVLELMVALCLRCENDIRTSMNGENHAGYWFRQMLISLGLEDMTDGYFDRRRADRIVSAFLDRDYCPNGQGSLFTLRNAFEDMRGIEIWYQMMMYLNEVTYERS